MQTFETSLEHASISEILDELERRGHVYAFVSWAHPERPETETVLRASPELDLEQLVIVLDSVSDFCCEVLVSNGQPRPDVFAHRQFEVTPK